MVILHCTQDHILWELTKSEQKRLTPFNLFPYSPSSLNCWTESSAQTCYYGGPCDKKRAGDATLS